MQGFNLRISAGASVLALALLSLTGCKTDDGAATETTHVAAVSAHTGEELYQANCAACHDQPEATKSPAKDAMKAMSFQFVNYTLTSGKMKAQGARLNDAERAVLVGYLTGRAGKPTSDWTAAFMCPANRRTVDVSGPSNNVGFGYDMLNTRKLTAAQAGGLTTAKMSDMELAWSIGFPDVAEMRATGSIVGNTLFFPVAGIGQVYAIALDGQPCFRWVYTAPGGAPLRTSSAYGKLADGSPLLVFSGLDSTVHAVDPRTGKAKWTKGVGVYSYSMTTGTPTVLKDRIIVPVAQFEITVGGENSYVCCTNHGYVLSLDPKTGAQQWRYDTMPDAKPLRDRGDGQMYYGPSGAPIWNSPAIDEKRGLIYFGTGEANSEPTHVNTDAVIAIGLKDGKERWAFQALGRDIYNYGCGVNPNPTRLNCSKDTVFRDADFGASMVLGKMSDGKELVFAGQKSGTTWALDPDTGKVIWQRDIGTGGALGGVHWGIAYDADTVFVPIANIGRQLPGGQPIDPALKAGIYALDAKTGAIKWMFSPPPPAPAAPGAAPAPRAGARNAAMSAAISVIDGAVVAGALDGSLYVIDAKTGKQLWYYQTAREFETANGIKAKGGSIDANSITAANGLLLVGSGYGQFGEIPGNVLMAFKPKGN